MKLEKQRFLAQVTADTRRHNYFLEALLSPAFHWYFTQGQQALEAELYVPGVAALLNGIEASLRVTVEQLQPDYAGDLQLSNYRLLSNTLLRQARALGMPIDALRFPDEADFEEKLTTKSNVQLVQLRHDICHGNMLGFIQEFEPGLQILTPECLRSISAILLSVCYDWAHELAEFRDARGRRPVGAPIPPIPANPLAEWLPQGAPH